MKTPSPVLSQATPTLSTPPDIPFLAPTTYYLSTYPPPTPPHITPTSFSFSFSFSFAVFLTSTSVSPPVINLN